jgi:hypothetical protein
MYTTIIAITGLITLVSLLGNLYLMGYMLKETYTIRKADKKKKKKKNKN